MTNKEITPILVPDLPQVGKPPVMKSIYANQCWYSWQQKLMILIVTVLFAVVGVGYALIASEQWSTKAVITAPKPEDLLPMRSCDASRSLGT